MARNIRSTMEYAPAPQPTTERRRAEDLPGRLKIKVVLSNSKHELFAQFVSSGLTAFESYVKAGYAPAGARTNASRLIANDRISARIKELQTAVSERVVDLAVRKRNWRVASVAEY